MSLKARFLLYLALVHLVFGVVAWMLLREQRLWLLLVELFFIVSFVVGWRLMRRLNEPADMLRTGVELLASGDLMSRFRETSQPEVNRLIRLYNQMVDHLREERTANQEQDSLLRKLIALSPSGKEGTTNFLTVRPRLCPHLTDALALESKAVNAAANDIAVKSRAALMAQASYFQLAGSLNNCLAAGVTAVKN